MENPAIPYLFFVTTVFLVAADNIHAQSIDDEFKRQLKQSLITDGPMGKPELKKDPFKIRQDRKEVLKVSPTPKLPTQYDRVELLEPESPEEKIHLNLEYTNPKTDQLSRSAYDYSTGKVIPIPDTNSKIQQGLNTRNDYGIGLYIDEESAPEWLRKIRNITTPGYSGFDVDPVRAIQRHKAAKRQEKINKILKVYDMK